MLIRNIVLELCAVAFIKTPTLNAKPPTY